MNLIDLTAKQLRNAANVQEKIQSLQHELNQILGHEVPTPLTGTARKSKRRMSAKGLANIRAGVAKRMRNQGGRTTSMPKRRMSAAGRARLSASAKARWRKAKAAGRGRL